MTNSKKRVGIVLFQLGGPDSLETVEPFLRNLFLDPDIIPLGPLNFIRGPLARYIARKRCVPVAQRYGQIGRRSPIGILTERQRVKLVQAVSPYIDPVAVTAMRYWKPLTEDAVFSLKQAGHLDELVLLPLYPHYSYATTLSSLKEWRRVYGEPSDTLPERTIEHFFDHPEYIQALVTNIGKCLRQFPDSSRIHLVFSAHGLPMSLVENGDPYPRHVQETIRLVIESGTEQFANWPRTHMLCFQSKVGPAKWLEPSFVGTLQKLGHQGVKEMLVVPISFVTEHIETLHEINIEGRADAKKDGIERYRMMPAVGDSPHFIECLKQLVLRAAEIHPDAARTTASSFVA
ncbi:MAG TPA: ferrochelatase [Candidatus Eisenbacteria bacterium]|nr:ferrochelatase [Candidatus Eisenbacteria bacterium]